MSFTFCDSVDGSELTILLKMFIYFISSMNHIRKHMTEVNRIWVGTNSTPEISRLFWPNKNIGELVPSAHQQGSFLTHPCEI